MRALLVTLLLVLLPVTATAALRPVESRFPQLEAELVPVLRGVFDAKSSVPLAVQGLSGAARELRTADVAGEAQAVDDALAGLRDLAIDGVTILDAYPPEPCWMDYSAVLRSGFLLLGDAASGDAARFSVGMFMVLDLGTEVRSEVSC